MLRSIFKFPVYGNLHWAECIWDCMGLGKCLRFEDSALEFSGVFGFGLGLSDFGLM